jgi:hypothetical protein
LVKEKLGGLRRPPFLLHEITYFLLFAIYINLQYIVCVVNYRFIVKIKHNNNYGRHKIC